MPRGFIPETDPELLIWVTNFKSNISAQAEVLGLSGAEVNTFEIHCSAIINAITNAEYKRKKFAEAVAFKETEKEAHLSHIRKGIVALKTNKAFTAATGQNLAIISSVQKVDTSAYKAHITAEKFAGFTRIKFIKKGVDGVNIYHRKKGEVAWKFLARDTKSPYDDHIELATPGQPEHWEYRAYGVINDAEIGQPSDIVEMVYVG